MSGTWVALTIATSLLLNAHASAQSLSDLVRAGRYEEAAALLSNADPEQARTGEALIFERAFKEDFQAGAWADAIRGFVAAKQVPHLNERQRQQLDFWHGVALANTVRANVVGPTALTQQEALAVLERAYDLLIASRDFAAGINQTSMMLNVARMIDSVSLAR